MTEQEASQITASWAEHRPILLNVRGHYSYLAERRDGAIVHGEEPEFEQSTVVAPNLEGLLVMLSQREGTRHALLERLFFAF